MDILGFFGLRRIKVDPRNPRFDLNATREYGPTWERKRQPGPGAMQYAYETLALSPVPPSGPSVRVERPLVPIATSPQQYIFAQTLYVQGVPITAGQLFSAPLYVPQENSFGIRGV